MNWWRLRFISFKIERNQNNEHFLEYLNSHESNAWIKTKGFSIGLSSLNRRDSMQILVGGSMPVISEKYEFDYQNKT